MSKTIKLIFYFSILAALLILLTNGIINVKKANAVYYPIYYPDWCPEINYICNNGPRVGDSGGCGKACPFGDAWAKYIHVGSCNWNYYGKLCSTGDKCVPGETGLHPGYCDCGSSGPIYKTCCSGSTPVACNRYYQQDNYPPPEGTCAPNSYVYGTSCPSAPAPPTPTPQPGVPTPTPKPGTTPTPGPGPTSPPVGACNNCLDWGDGSNVAAWCACELLCTGTNTNPACLAAPLPPPTSCSARGGFCAYNGSCPTNKGYSNVGATSDCPGGCCACN